VKMTHSVVNLLFVANVTQSVLNLLQVVKRGAHSRTAAKKPGSRPAFAHTKQYFPAMMNSPAHYRLTK
jgi:hypothetical protein